MPSFLSTEKRKEAERSLEGFGHGSRDWRKGRRKSRKANVTLFCQLVLFVFMGMSTNTGSEQRYFKSSEGSQHPRKKYANRYIWNQWDIRTPLYIGVTFPVCFHYTVSALNRTRKDISAMNKEPPQAISTQMERRESWGSNLDKRQLHLKNKI